MGQTDTPISVATLEDRRVCPVAIDRSSLRRGHRRSAVCNDALMLLALALSSIASPTVAQAQSAAEIASRRSMLDEATRARNAGDHARALDFAVRAGQLGMTPSVRMFIATEQAATGHLAAALGTSELCVHETERDATVSNREAILSACRSMMNDLRARVGRVIVDVPADAPPGLVISVAGEPISSALYGAPYVVTPGEVVIEASATGRRPATLRLHVTSGQVVHATLPTLADVASTPATNARASAPSTPVSSTHGANPMFVAGIGFAALAVVAGGAAAIFYALRQSALTGCVVEPDTVACPAGAPATNERMAPTWNALIDVSFVVGGVALAASGTFFVLARLRRNADHASRSITPIVGLGTLGLQVVF